MEVCCYYSYNAINAVRIIAAQQSGLKSAANFMPPVVFCLCPNCSCYSPVFNISDVAEIAAVDETVVDVASDSSNAVAAAEPGSRIGENLVGLICFLLMVVLITAGKVIKLKIITKYNGTSRKNVERKERKTRWTAA